MKKINYLLLALFLTSLLSSCLGGKKLDVQNVEAINLHISKFALEKPKENKDEKDQDKTLSRVFFSIDNSKEEGLITNNQHPVPYGFELNKVYLDVMPKHLGAVAVEFSEDKGESYEQIKENKSKLYHIKPNKDLYRVRIKYVSEINGKEYTYVYRVEIKQFEQDPQSITWEEVKADQPLDELYSFTDGELVQANYSGATPKLIKRYGENIVTLAEDQKFYQLKDKQWQALEQLNKVIADKGYTEVRLLGLLPSRDNQADRYVLVLLLEKDGQKIFANYNVTSQKLSEGAVAQNLDFADTYSLVMSQKAKHLRLVTSSLSTYETTNGLDWGLLANGVGQTAEQGHLDILEMKSKLYGFISDNGGLSVYSLELSEDKWLRHREVASSGLQSFGNSPLKIWKRIEAEAEVLYLYKGGSEPKLYKGTPRPDSL